MISLKQLACWLALAIAASAAVGCATTDKKRARGDRVSEVSKKKKNRGPENFTLYRTRDIDQRLLKRGQRQMQSAALDSY